MNEKTQGALDEQSKSDQQEWLDLISNDPIFKTLGITDLTVEDNGYSAVIRGGEKVYLFRGDGKVGKVINIALYRPSLSLSTIAGSAAASLKGIHLNEAVFIASPEANEVAVDEVPSKLKGKLTDLLGQGGSIKLVKGVDAYASIDLGKSDSDILKFIENTLGVRGAVAFAGSMGAEALGALTGNGGGVQEFSLSVSAAQAAPKALAWIGSGKNLEFAIKRENGVGHFSGKVDFFFKIGGETLEVPLDLVAYNPNAKAGETYMELSGGFLHLPRFLSKIPGLVTDSLTGKLTATVATGGGHALDVALEAAGKIHGTHSDFTIEFERDARGKIVDYAAAFHNTKLPLGDLPGLQQIPGAKTFTLEDPVASLDSLGGRVNFRGESFDAVIFKDPVGGWNMGLRIDKRMSLGELIGKNKGLMAELHLPKVQFILSTKGLTSDFSKLPLALRKFFANEDGSLPTGELIVHEGFNIRGTFDPGSVSPEIKKMFETIGVAQQLALEGTLGGVFGGPPSIAIEAELTGGHSHGFPFLKAAPGAAESFFIKFSEVDVAVGVKTSILLPGSKGQPPLIFDVAFEIDESESGVEVMVAGDMRGDWNDAIGIKGLTLENPYLSVGINETGGFDLLIDGAVIVGKERVRATADIVIEPEAGFVPESLALAGEIKFITFTDLSHHGDKAAQAKHGKGLKGGGFENFKAALKNLKFAFMTPGSRLPPDLEEELHIVGAGIAMNGELWIDGKEIGKAGGYISGMGLAFDGKIDPIKLGPIDLKDAKLDIQANISSLPMFRMSGDIELFEGFEEKYRIDLELSDIAFTMDTEFGGLFEVSLDAKTLHGVSFAPSNDLEFDAKLDANYEKQFSNLVQGALKGMKQADRSLEKAQSGVEAAKEKVNGLKSKIAASQAADKRDYDNARRGIDAAERKVNSINGAISAVKRNIHDLERAIKSDKKHLRLADAAKHGVQLGAQETALGADYSALKSAQWALEQAKKAAQVAVEGISPNTRALQTQLAAEQAGLDAALESLKIAEGADKGMEEAFKAVQTATNDFQIHEISVAGSLRGIVTAGRYGRNPMIKVKALIVGQKQTLTVNIGKGEKDFGRLVKHLADEVAHDLVKALTPKEK